MMTYHERNDIELNHNRNDTEPNIFQTQLLLLYYGSILYHIEQINIKSIIFGSIIYFVLVCYVFYEGNFETYILLLPSVIVFVFLWYLIYKKTRNILNQ